MVPACHAPSAHRRMHVVAKGAIIEGDMAVTSGSPVVHFEEKRGNEPTVK